MFSSDIAYFCTVSVMSYNSNSDNRNSYINVGIHIHAYTYMHGNTHCRLKKT
uniref:Uncharacterized protein n=1 Tax=Anguilla anguilla TaxID=7936 RepID=A0A0E9V5Z0_ANGAN